MNQLQGGGEKPIVVSECSNSRLLSTWLLLALIGVVLILLGPIPEWASYTGLLSGMGGFGDLLARFFNFILRFFLILIGVPVATIALITGRPKTRESLSLMTIAVEIILVVFIAAIAGFIFFESPRRVWAGNQDAPLTWTLGVIAYIVAVMGIDSVRAGRVLVPLGVALAVLGWINLLDLVVCPAGCRAWALKTGVVFGVYAVVIGGALLVISRYRSSKVITRIAYAMILLHVIGLPLSWFFFQLGV